MDRVKLRHRIEDGIQKALERVDTNAMAEDVLEHLYATQPEPPADSATVEPDWRAIAKEMFDAYAAADELVGSPEAIRRFHDAAWAYKLATVTPPEDGPEAPARAGIEDGTWHVHRKPGVGGPTHNHDGGDRPHSHDEDMFAGEWWVPRSPDEPKRTVGDLLPSDGPSQERLAPRTEGSTRTVEYRGNQRVVSRDDVSDAAFDNPNGRLNPPVLIPRKPLLNEAATLLALWFTGHATTTTVRQTDAFFENIEVDPYGLAEAVAEPGGEPAQGTPATPSASVEPDRSYIKHPAERAIQEAVDRVEELGAHPDLTAIVHALGKQREAVEAWNKGERSS